MDYKALSVEVQDLARRSGKFIRDEQKKITTSDVQLKGVTSLVTYVDKTVEKTLVSALTKLIHSGL